MLEALCRQSSTTLDIVHAEDGPPITQRTSGLGSKFSRRTLKGKTRRDISLLHIFWKQRVINTCFCHVCRACLSRRADWTLSTLRGLRTR